MKRRRAAQCRSLSLYCRHRSSTASGTASAGGGDIVQQTRRPRPAEEGTQPPGTGPGGGKGGPGPEVSRPHVRPGPRLASPPDAGERRPARPGPARSGPAQPRRPHSPRPGPAGARFLPPPPFSTPNPAPLSRSAPAASVSRGRAKHRETARERRALPAAEGRRPAARSARRSVRLRSVRSAYGTAACREAAAPRRAHLGQQAAGSGQLTPRDGRAQHSAGCRGCCSKWALPPHSGAVR